MFSFVSRDPPGDPPGDPPLRRPPGDTTERGGRQLKVKVKEFEGRGLKGFKGREGGRRREEGGEVKGLE